MSRNKLLAVVVRTLVSAITLLFWPGTSAAQLPPGSPLTDFADTRFRGTDEDWTSPALNTSHLRPVTPLVGYVDEEPSYSVELIRVQWRWRDPIDLYVVKPKGAKKPPVIVYLYGYPSDTDIFKDPKFQAFVTQDGFAAVGFVTALTGHRYHDRPMKKWFVSELQESLAVSAHDVQLVLDYLAVRGDLDMERVGVFAQLSGASVAILASAMDPRIKVLDALDPWGDWPTWMEASPFVPEEERANYVKPEFLGKLAGLEPVQWIAKVQAKKFRLEQRSFDEETPVSAKEKLQAAAPSGAMVRYYKTPDEFVKAIGPGGTRSLDWMKEELRSLAKDGSSGTTLVGKAN